MEAEAERQWLGVAGADISRLPAAQVAHVTEERDVVLRHIADLIETGVPGNHQEVMLRLMG